jgi:hypothetical protein
MARCVSSHKVFVIINHFVLLLVLALGTVSCATGSVGPVKDPLRVTHDPNPTPIFQSNRFQAPPYPYMWFYRTTIENRSDRFLKIIWFESYFEKNGKWRSNNILGAVMGKEVFSMWYEDLGTGDMDPQGWIRPGGRVYCRENWHWSDRKKPPVFKWAYLAVDRFGNDYYVEAIIKSVPQK